MLNIKCIKVVKVVKIENKGLHIAFEGIDGCGGTTQCNMVKDYLKKLDLKVYTTQEPSSNEIGVILRKFLRDSNIHPSTDALLFAADRSHHFFNEIKPKLEENYIVLSDRFLESSIAYQAAQSNKISIEWIKSLNKFVEKPQITIILDISPETSLARKGDQELEKFEEKSFLKKVREIYLQRAKQEDFYVINSEKRVEVVHKEIQEVIMKQIKPYIKKYGES